MAANPVKQPPPVLPSEDIEQRFQRLNAQWSADTLVLSDPAKIMGHPAMRSIIAIGEEVVPIILREMQAEPSLLVWALPEITGENVSFKGNNDDMVEAWLHWGREKGLV